MGSNKKLTRAKKRGKNGGESGSGVVHAKITRKCTQDLLVALTLTLGGTPTGLPGADETKGRDNED
jgi:hypothetical protein